jgi:tetratricopeptide (TPR) repeat protein
MLVVGTWAIGAATAFVGCGGEGAEGPGTTVPTTTNTVTTTASTTTGPVTTNEPSLDDRRKAAKAAYDAGDMAKAQTELEVIVAKEPADVNSQAMLGDVYASRNDKRAADAYLAATKADGGKNEKIALMAAHALFGQQRWDDVLTVTTSATKSNDKSMPLWMYLGLAQSAKMDWAGATGTYEKLTIGWPDEPELWARLAVSQANGGRKDDAKKTAKTALEKWNEVRSPKSTKEVMLGRGPDELCIIARALRRADDAKGALAALGHFKPAKDELAPAVDIETGFAKRLTKDDKQAYQLADKVLKMTNGGSPSAHLLLAFVALDHKKPEITKAQLLMYDSLGGDLAYAVDRKDVEESLAKAPAAEPEKTPEKKPTEKPKK